MKNFLLIILFTLLPFSLNAESNHIDMMAQLTEQHLQGWSVNSETAQRFQLATKLGAKD